MAVAVEMRNTGDLVVRAEIVATLIEHLSLMFVRVRRVRGGHS